jgi:hypothetical protein
MMSSIIKDAAAGTRDFDIIQLKGEQYVLAGVCWRPKNGFCLKPAWKPQDDLSCTPVHRICVHRSE